MMRVYTDGGCSGNPGPGGWGYVVLNAGTIREDKGFELDTTNNRMELMAAIKALESIMAFTPVPVTVVTDSQYVKNGITAWIHKWKANDWVSSSGEAVKNVDLWQRLDQARSPHAVEWVWVRGHNGDPGNEAADALANRGVDSVVGGARR